MEVGINPLVTGLRSPSCWLLLAAMVGLCACPGEIRSVTSCVPGETVACVCPNMQAYSQVCGDDGQFGECLCPTDSDEADGRPLEDAPLDVDETDTDETDVSEADLRDEGSTDTVESDADPVDGIDNDPDAADEAPEDSHGEDAAQDMADVGDIAEETGDGADSAEDSADLYDLPDLRAEMPYALLAVELDDTGPYVCDSEVNATAVVYSLDGFEMVGINLAWEGDIDTDWLHLSREIHGAPVEAGLVEVELHGGFSQWDRGGSYEFMDASISNPVDPDSPHIVYNAEDGDLPAGLEGLTIEMTCDTTDSEGPQLLEVLETNPTAPIVLGCGETVQVQLRVQDVGSGLNYISLHLSSDDRALGISAPISATSGTKDVVISTRIDDYADSDYFTFSSLSMSDNANNTTMLEAGDDDLPEGLSGFNIEVACEHGDTDPPSLVSVGEVTPGTVTRGEQADISITVTDDVSGLQRVEPVFHGPDSRATATCAAGFGDEFDCEIRTWHEMPLGVYSLSEVTLRDRARREVVIRAGDPGFPEEGSIPAFTLVE